MANRPYENLLPDTPDVIKCREFLLKNVKTLGVNSGTGMIISDTYEASCINGPCHASLHLNDFYMNPRIACGAVNPNKEQFPTTMRVLEWIFNASPWEDMFKDGFEVVWGKDDLPKGIIFSETCCKKFPADLFKNIFILFRCIQEFYTSFQAWESLVDNGVHPDDAFFLCRLFALVGDNNFSPSAHPYLEGWHWPIWYERCNYSGVKSQKTIKEQFDWDAWYSHKFNNLTNRNMNEQIYNRFFMKKGDKPSPDLLQVNSIQFTKKSRFSSVSVLDSESILKAYNSWKDEYGIKKVSENVPEKCLDY